MKTNWRIALLTSIAASVESITDSQGSIVLEHAIIVSKSM